MTLWHNVPRDRDGYLFVWDDNIKIRLCYCCASCSYVMLSSVVSISRWELVSGCPTQSLCSKCPLEASDTNLVPLVCLLEHDINFAPDLSPLAAFNAVTFDGPIYM